DKCLTELGTETMPPLSNLSQPPDSGTGQLYYVSAMDIQPDYKIGRRYKLNPLQIELQSANTAVPRSESFVWLWLYLSLYRCHLNNTVLHPSAHKNNRD